MKKWLLLFALFSAINSMAQVKYDDLPGGIGQKFVDEGGWGRTNITYFFQNGTTDIANNDEWNAVRQAFAIWADYAPLTFTEVTTAAAADIVILWGTFNHGDSYPFDGTPATDNVLAHAFPPGRFSGSIRGDVHFDDSETWTTLEMPFPFPPFDLVTVAAHEIGHALGLGHSDETCALMNPFYNSSHRYLAPDDIAGIRALYGTRSPIQSSNVTCNGGTYAVNNRPTGSSVTWTSSDNSIATINSQGVYTWTGTKSGTVTFTATILLPCGLTYTEAVNKYLGRPVIYSGFYKWTNYPYEQPMGLVESPGGPNTVCYSRPSTTMTTIMDIRGASTVKWEFDYITQGVTWGQSGNNLTVNFRLVNQTGDFLLTASNSCFSASKFYSFKSITCSSRKSDEPEQITITPNPASANLRIAVASGITSVKIYDVTGRLRKSQQGSRSVTMNINTSDLTNGIYFVEINNGSTSIRKNIQILH